MKTLIFSVLFAPIATFAQNFTVSGQISSLKDGDKIFLFYQPENKAVTIDSAWVKNHQFRFSGSINNPENAMLSVNLHPERDRNKQPKKDELLNIILEKGNITVNGNTLGSAIIGGSSANADRNKLAKLLEINEKEIEKIGEDAQRLSDTDTAGRTAIKNRYRAERQKMMQTSMGFIRENPKSYYSLMLVNEILESEPDNTETNMLFGAIDTTLKNTAIGQSISKKLEAYKITQIGAMAKDFTQNDVNGKPVKLSDFRGKYVLVDFWASWCIPCREENPNVVAAFNQYKDKGFTVLGVSLDQPGHKADWLKAIETDKLTWTHVSDLKYFDNEVARTYGVNFIPFNLLIGPDGKVVAKNLRGEALHNELKKHLAK